MSTIGHTSVSRGKRVIVKLWKGEVFEDRFIEGKPSYIEFEKSGRVPRGKIKNLTIYKGRGLVPRGALR